MDALSEKVIRRFMALPLRQLPSIQAEFVDGVIDELALAYVGLADCYLVLIDHIVLEPNETRPKIRSVLEQALKLDDRLAEAHASLGNLLQGEWNWPGAEAEYKRAIELNPNYATVHHWYSHYLMQVGRTEDSLREAKLAQELDPLSPFVNNGLARQYYLARRYDESIAQCRVGLQIDATYLPARIQLALAYEQKGQVGEAIAELEKARSMASSLLVVHALLAHAYAVAGRKSEAQSELNVLTTAASHNQYVPASYLAIIWLAMGDKDKAFTYLDRSYQDRSEQMLYLAVEPLVDPLRGDPRFDSLLKRVGLKR